MQEVYYSVGLARAVDHIYAATRDALQAVSSAANREAANSHKAGSDVAARVSLWGLGLAGACTQAEQALMRGALHPLVARLGLRVEAAVVDEDAAAAQRGAFGGGAGIVCIAGTGANAFGIAEGLRGRADGLGPLLGDRGSGYAIGEEAFRALCRADDGSGPQTMLLPLVLRSLGIASVDELVPLVYDSHFPKDRVAALFPIVLDCARQGDDVANRILREAGCALAATTLAVMRKLDVRLVAPCGGVLARDSPVRAAFEKALEHALPDARIAEPRHDAAVGASLLVHAADDVS